MGNADEKLTENLELRTQEYSVLITDSKRTSCGSGVLYYSGMGNMFYVFTCAHVLDELTELIEVHFLIPIDREKEDYQVCCARVSCDQIIYSSIDEITMESGVKRHSVDAAVICLKKDESLPLEATHYLIAEARKNDKVFAQGFPGGIHSDEKLVELLDIAHGTVLHNLPDKQNFMFRIEDKYLDAGNRVYELNGFSGSPIWNSNEEVLSIFGILASGVGETVYRGKVSAVKMEAIRSIMKNHFDILLESRIIGIPEEDVAGGQPEVLLDKTRIVPGEKNIYDEWLNGQIEKVRTYIDDIKFQNAIDFAAGIMQDKHFEHCSDDAVKRHMQHLLYCYEACLMEDEFNALEDEMRRRKLLRGHDPLRWLTFNFAKKNYKETIEYAEKILTNGTNNDAVFNMAKVFRVICKAYTEKASVEETLLQFLDERENLKMEKLDSGMEALIYQMLGFVYGECYKQYTKAVRCLNRAYRIGADNAVLESLACAYYFLSLQGAVREDDTVDMERVDRANLNKARECFLIILEKADDLYFSAMLKREGIVLFNTFYFLQDNYRILTIYPLLRKYMPPVKDCDKRDLEMKYTMTLCQRGRVNLSLFNALTEEDKVLIRTIGAINEMTGRLEFKNPSVLSRIPQLEHDMHQLIDLAEQNISKIEKSEKMIAITALINLYGWGKRIFGWDVAVEIERHLAYIKSAGNEKAVIVFENFLFENSHSVEKAELQFIESWKKNPSFETWQEILQFYKRNWMLDKADAMFKDLFENHAEYVRDEQEYAYRAYIDYIVNYRRDIKDALRFFVTHKHEMKDEDIRGFWEHELMIFTNSFNNPERFDEERLFFVEQGLLSPDEYHRIALIAYMCNLNSEKAWEHFNTDNPSFGFFNQVPYGPYLTKEGAQFLIWQRKFPPHMEPDWNGMIESRLSSVWSIFNGEEWHVRVDDIKNALKFSVNRNIAIDAWALYLLATESKLDILEEFDNVFVTHSSIARILEEMCHYENHYLESTVAYFEIINNVKLQSPDFEHQLFVREKAEYYEPCSTIATALEAGCPALIGDPVLGEDVINGFKDIIIRPCDFEQIME